MTDGHFHEKVTRRGNAAELAADTSHKGIHHEAFSRSLHLNFGRKIALPVFSAREIDQSPVTSPHLPAHAVRAEVSKPRLADERSTKSQCHWRAEQLSQQRHVTRSLLSLSRFRRLRPRECGVGTIIAIKTNGMIVFETILKTYEQ